MLFNIHIVLVLQKVALETFKWNRVKIYIYEIPSFSFVRFQDAHICLWFTIVIVNWINFARDM